jgi:hypothetical protein
VASDLDSQVRNLSAHPPAASNGNQQFATLTSLINQAGIEESVLQAACPNETDRIPIDSQLHATTAWALVQQADLVQAQSTASCPAASEAVTAQFLGAAWYEIAKGTPVNPPVPRAIASVAPMVQTRAAAVKLTLPPVADTSAFWRDGLQQKAQSAMGACIK